VLGLCVTVDARVLSTFGGRVCVVASTAGAVRERAGAVALSQRVGCFGPGEEVVVMMSTFEENVSGCEEDGSRW